MSVLIRHTVSESKKPFWKIVASVFSIVILLNIVIELTNHLPVKIAMLLSFKVVILSLSICFYIINHKVAKYIYTIINNELTIKQEKGNVEKTLLNIKIKDIEAIKPVSELQKEKKCFKVLRMCCKLKNKGVYFGQYRENGKIYRFIFQPNEGIYNEIFRQLNENI